MFIFQDKYFFLKYVSYIYIFIIKHYKKFNLIELFEWFHHSFENCKNK